MIHDDYQELEYMPADVPSEHVDPAPAPRLRRRLMLPPSWYDVREFVRVIGFAAAAAGLILADIWLGQHL